MSFGKLEIEGDFMRICRYQGAFITFNGVSQSGLKRRKSMQTLD